MRKIATALLTASLFLLTACANSAVSPSLSDSLPPPIGIETEETTTEADTEPPAPQPEREMRGVWVATVTNLNFPSRKGLSAAALAAELDAILSVLSECGMNAIFFQVRPASDSLYRSALFPASAVLSGTQGVPPDGDFDPLAYLIEHTKPLGIDVYAWVNPLRVTTGSAAYPQQDLSKLAESNPARQHPSYTVAYADGKCYYDCGLPEVRALVAEGCREIAANYDIAGVIFDDYFYPYPVSGAVFDDAASYAIYGNGLPLADWRRANVNALVEACYTAIKEADPACAFGIAPFGIWQNDNGVNGGSATRGLEAYHSIYCDALAWVEGGYIDFLAPQIYWSFDTAAAPFATLADWWDTRLADNGVKLYISHAAYKLSTWGNVNELERQITYLRMQTTCRGSILYSYAALRDDLLSLRAVMATLNESPLFFPPETEHNRKETIS